MIYGLDLFSGIGGLSLALQPWVETVAYCENDRYAQAVLLSRMWNNELPTAGIWDDVTTLVPSVLPRTGIDIITAGFPCQDISVAGTNKGLEGSRSGLFFEIIRLCRDLRPSFVFLENVPAITVRGLDRVLMEFTEIGYDCRWTIVSAAEFGAVHIRERWFLLAHSASTRLEGLEQHEGSRQTQSMSADRILQEISEETLDKYARKVDGLPIPVDRIRGLGNAVVPVQAREAFKKLIGDCVI